MSEFSSLITIVVPTALVAALSPTTFAVLILLLSVSNKPKTNCLGFLAGSSIIILLAALIGFLAAEGASLVANTEFNLLPAGINAILGVILLYFGIKTAFNKEYNNNEENVENKLKDKYSSFGFSSSLLLALGLFSLNLITSILVFYASNQIGASDVNLMGKIISLFLLVTITLLLVEIPLLILLFAPKKANNILSSLNIWIQKNGHYLTAILVIIIGVYMLFKGLNGLNFI